MKVSLVVASGAHEGRVVPLAGAQFLIGRDQQCNLRPASPAISKLHCAVLIRDGKVSVKDFGSTNGTLVNGQLIQATEVVVADGASLQVGPLDFTVRIEKTAARADGTPLGDSPETAAALAAVKAAAGTAPKAPVRDTTPAPAKSGATAKPAAPAPSKPGVAKAPEATKPATNEAPALMSSDSTSDEDHDRVAAMLLGMDDDGNGSVPDGSTVMEIPNPLTAGTTEESKSGEKKPGEPKKAQTREEMTNAANDLLRQYMRRPK
ncbi:MAG TPA: FHA domain-containing protein [Gemmata sp.]